VDRIAKDAIFHSGTTRDSLPFSITCSVPA
jgi:hypothetical protein